MPARILVPLDGSAFAEQALPYAALLARRCQAELLLARAVPPVAVFGAAATYLEASIGDTWATAVDAAQAHLDRLVAGLAEQGVPAETAIVGGRAAEALLDLARQPAVSLIVMATHGRAGPSRWALGSTAEAVVRRSPRPVLLLTPRALAAGTPERLRRRLLVATDGSATSEAVYPAAAALARCTGAPLSLVQAIAPAAIYAREVRALFDSTHPLDLQQEVIAAALEAMRPTVEGWREEGLTADAAVEVGGPTAALARLAARRDAGWLALASHGRGGLSGLVLGSTALAALRTTSLPVLLVSAGAVEARPAAPALRTGAAGDAAGKTNDEPLAVISAAP